MTTALAGTTTACPECGAALRVSIEIVKKPRYRLVTQHEDPACTWYADLEKTPTGGAAVAARLALPIPGDSWVQRE